MNKAILITIGLFSIISCSKRPLDTVGTGSPAVNGLVSISQKQSFDTVWQGNSQKAVVSWDLSGTNPIIATPNGYEFYYGKFQYEFAGSNITRIKHFGTTHSVYTYGKTIDIAYNGSGNIDTITVISDTNIVDDRKYSFEYSSGKVSKVYFIYEIGGVWDKWENASTYTITYAGANIAEIIEKQVGAGGATRINKHTYYSGSRTNNLKGWSTYLLLNFLDQSIGGGSDVVYGLPSTMSDNIIDSVHSTYSSSPSTKFSKRYRVTTDSSGRITQRYLDNADYPTTYRY